MPRIGTRTPQGHHSESIAVIEYLESMRCRNALHIVAKRWGFGESTLQKVSYDEACVSKKMLGRYYEFRDVKY